MAYHDIDDDFVRSKENFILWKGGPYWKNDLKLHQFLDVIMHLIFLGITKSTDIIIKNGWDKS